MARHNREASGQDQRGFDYTVSYQPDWLRRIKVTRILATGRQSTKTLFRNPAKRWEALPGDSVRTRITSAEQGMDVEVTVTNLGDAVREVRVTCEVPGDAGLPNDLIEFTIEAEHFPRP